MLNESKHLKVNFGSLPVPANCQRTTWLNWLLESIKTDTATFVQVEDQTGNSRWELLDSTTGLSERIDPLRLQNRRRL